MIAWILITGCADVDPSGHDGADVETVAPEPAHAEPAHAEPEPAHAGPELAHAEPAHAEPAHAEPGPVEPEPAASEPVPPQPVAAEIPAPTAQPIAGIVRAIGWRLILAVLALAAVQRLQRTARLRLAHLSQEVGILRFGATVLVLAWLVMSVVSVVQPVGGAAPLIVLLAAVVPATVLGTVWLPRYLEGLWLVLRGAMIGGNRFQVGDVAGRIVDVGLLRVRIEDDDGRFYSLPMASLGGATVSVIRASAHVPVEVALDGVEPGPVRCTAVLSPFRDTDHPVQVAVEGTLVTVRAVAWSASAARRLEAQLRQHPLQ